MGTSSSDLFHQKQRYQNDCCLAACASMMGIDYDVAFPKEWQEARGEKGTYGNEVEKTMAMVGLTKDKVFRVYNYFGQGNEGWEISIRKNTLNGLLWGRRALLQVPSINFERKSHLIVWRYGEIWDPSNLQVYKELGDTTFEYAWLINENSTPK